MTPNPYLPPPLPERRVRPALIGALAVLVLVVGGVGAWLLVGRGDDGTGVPAAANVGSSSAPAAPEESAPTSAAAVSPAKAAVLKLGDKQKITTTDGYVLEVTALKVKRGDSYEGVQVRTCNRGPDVSVSRGPWSLAYDDFESLHTIDVVGGGLPAPAYEERDLAQGQCAKGWVNYSVVPGERPIGIQYSPENGDPVRWSFAS